MFDISKLQWTDPDELQFCEKITDNCYHYIQVDRATKEGEDIYNKYGGNVPQLIEDKIELNENNTFDLFVDIDDYDDDTIGDVISSYGIDVNSSEAKQLICEGIFETEYQSNIIDSNIMI